MTFLNELDEIFYPNIILGTVNFAIPRIKLVPLLLKWKIQTRVFIVPQAAKKVVDKIIKSRRDVKHRGENQRR